MAILDLATYKAYKKINSDTEDTKNTNTINAVNTFIEAYTGRVFTTFYATDNIEYFSALDSELYPTEHPIVSITALEWSSDAGQNYGNTLAEFTDYIIDIKDQAIIAINDAFASPTVSNNAIRLTYKGGYAETPKDLELAAVHLTDYYRDEEYIPRKSMSGTSVDTVIQPDLTARLPTHIRRVLENYRNIVF